MDNDWHSCLRDAKDFLDKNGEHMGTGEMFRLILLSRDELVKMKMDSYLVENKREIYDAIYFGISGYMKEYC